MPRLTAFGGMIPAQDDRLIPPNNAAYSQNAWLYAGTLEPMRKPVLIYTCADPFTTKVFRLPNSFLDKSAIVDSFWMEFQNADTDVVRSPLASDSFDRYYWAATTHSPRYNTRTRIENGDPFYTLGVPTPAPITSVVPTGGVSATIVSRSYVYTNVTAYGEEGAVSNPTLVTGKQDDTFTVTMPAYAPPADRPVTQRRIYRTVTSSVGVATYFFVAEISVGTNTYADTKTDVQVTAQGQLTTLDYTPPPALEGIVTLPNGMIAGWIDNEIWFCEPYLPHAWPAKYALSVDYPIVGMGVIGQTIIVCTNSTPYAVTGVHPDSMSQAKIGTYEPCMARGSIVSSPEGVYYASANGLVLASSGNVQVVSDKLLSKNKWLELLTVPKLKAAKLGSAYYCFGSARQGMFEETAFDTDAFEQQDFTGARDGALIDLSDGRVAFNLLHDELACSSVFSDAWSGEVLMVKEGQLFLIDTTDSAQHGTFLWRSKVIQSNQAGNFGAFRVDFRVPNDIPPQNPVRNVEPTQTLAADQYGIIRVYADDRLVMTRELRTSGEVMRGTSGFKADYWQIEIEGRVEVTQVVFAGSPWGLNSE